MEMEDKFEAFFEGHGFVFFNFERSVTDQGSMQFSANSFNRSIDYLNSFLSGEWS